MFESWMVKCGQLILVGYRNSLEAVRGLLTGTLEVCARFNNEG